LLFTFFSDKDFTTKNVKFVERKTVEHLLRRPCFIDSGRCPRSAPILLGYEPSYKSFQKRPTVKDSRQAEVTVSRPGRDQEDIIEAVPVTVRREAQIPQLVTPLTNPNFVPSVQTSEVRLPVIRFPSVFDPTPNTSEDMPTQKRSINLGSVLGSLAPQTSETSTLPLAPGFSEGESVMKRRKRGQEGAEEAGEQQALASTKPSKTKSPFKKGKSKNDRALQKAIGHVSHKRKHQKDSPVPWSCEFYVDSRPMDEEDSVWKSKDIQGRQIADTVGRALLLPKDMRAWQGNNSTQMVENLKRDSVLVSFVFYPFFFFFFNLITAFRLSKEFLKLDLHCWRPNVFSMNLSLRMTGCANLRKRPRPKFKRLRANTKAPRQGCIS
jgi:hypothetical protein